MKFSCTKDNLSHALSIVGNMTGKNTNLPILNNVLLQADQQKVDIIATNLELAARVGIRAKVEVPGSFTVPARTLAEFVALLPNERVDLEVVGTDLAVSCGKSTTKIKGSVADDFPIIPTVEGGKGFVVGVNEFSGALTQVLPAVARNEIRPELAGIFFGFNVGGVAALVLAATDSYRLAEKRLPLLQGNDEIKVVVPGRTAQEINHILGSSQAEDGEKQVRLLVTENQLAVNYNNVQVVSRLVEGSYPDYTQIIPKEFNTTVLVPVDRLTKELRAAGLFTTTGVNAVMLTFKPAAGLIEITSTSSQTGEYRSEIEAEVKGVEASVFLNHRYVLDGLTHMSSGDVLIKIISGESPCVMVPTDESGYLYIVMPVRQ